MSELEKDTNKKLGSTEQDLRPEAIDLTPLDNQPQNTQSNLDLQRASQKKGRKKIAFFVVLGVILLAILGFFAYLLFFQQKPVEPNNNSTATTKEESKSDSSAKTIIEKIRKTVNDELATTFPDMTIENSTYGPAYKPEGINYAVRDGDLGLGLTISPELTHNEDSIAKVRETVSSSLDKESWTTKTSTDWNVTYQSKVTVCSLSTEGSPVGVSCVDISSYTTLITRLKPFAEAYLVSEDGKQYGEGVLMSNPVITNSSDGYGHASVSMGSTLSPIGGFAGLFYIKNGEWTYWRGTQNQLACEDFNTYDLQKAFEGIECYESTANDQASKVTVTLRAH